MNLGSLATFPAKSGRSTIVSLKSPLRSMLPRTIYWPWIESASFAHSQNMSILISKSKPHERAQPPTRIRSQPRKSLDNTCALLQLIYLLDIIFLYGEIFARECFQERR